MLRQLSLLLPENHFFYYRWGCLLRCSPSADLSLTIPTRAVGRGHHSWWRVREFGPCQSHFRFVVCSFERLLESFHSHTSTISCYAHLSIRRVPNHHIIRRCAQQKHQGCRVRSWSKLCFGLLSSQFQGKALKAAHLFWCAHAAGC